MKKIAINVKHERRNSELKKVINSVVFSSKNAAQFADIYFTRIDLTKDTKDAKIFFVFVSDEAIEKSAEVIEKLNGIKKEIQLAVPKAMRLKFVPKMMFKLDDEYYKSKRIEKIFEEIKSDDEARDEAND